MHYDLTIIGGGIAGAGVAQAAAAAGFKVLLLEKGDFGQQTSSSSSKLIHGGLRYLESAQASLVYTALKERRALLRLAPNLVKPMRFYIPVYKHAKRGKWLLRAGLSLYAMFCILDPLSRFKELPKRQWRKIKNLNTNGLETVFQYWDAQTDDEKLTQAVINSAKSLGANCVPFAAFCSSQKSGQDFTLNYQQSNALSDSSIKDVISVTSSVIVNAAGPWVNDVLSKITPKIEPYSIDWVQGTHIILDVEALSHIYYLESNVDNRVVFVMPWQGKTLVGTTETLLTSLPNSIKPLQQEIDYLLKIYQHYFPNQSSRVIDSFAGVRVLPKQDAQAFSRQRESIIYQVKNCPNVINLYGGKLTTFRATSKEVVTHIEKILGQRVSVADIDQLQLN